MWKGCFSMAAYDGIKMVLESIIGEVTSFEKYLTSFVYLLYMMSIFILIS